MKNIITLIIILSSWLTVYSQVNYTQAELKLKCDSIIEESNTLYRYEMAAWNFTDLFVTKPDIMETIQSCLVYQQGDTIKCIVIDNQAQCTYEASFLYETVPCSEVKACRSLSEYEVRLIEAKKKIQSAFDDDKKYPVYGLSLIHI